MTLALERLTKRHPGGRGVEDVSFTAEPGEVIALVGPSGCGKTTLLRAVAGLAPPDAGRVVLRGRDITALPPERRNVGLIFQNYALFPHLSVFDNVAYGLRARGGGREAIAAAVHQALRDVDLAGRDGRIDQLSGGEQQRVAVARAVVTEPHALLLDEPLSNLDANLRHRMRSNLRAILKRLGIPSIHVTHDQEEALAIADRVAILDAGRLAQIGPPEEVHHRPRSAFVARFLGGANVLRGRVASVGDGRIDIVIAPGATCAAATTETWAPGDAVDLAIRPEVPAIAGPGGAGIEVRVTERAFLGAAVELRCDLHGGALVIRAPGHGAAARVHAGDTIHVVLDPAHVHAMRPS